MASHRGSITTATLGNALSWEILQTWEAAGLSWGMGDEWIYGLQRKML